MGQRVHSFTDAYPKERERTFRGDGSVYGNVYGDDFTGVYLSSNSPTCIH